VSQAVVGQDAADGHPGRFMKGSELAADGQYTQDTQLHPAIATEIGSLFSKLGESKLAKGLPAPNYVRPQSTVDALAQDFETQTQLNVLGSEAVNTTLHELPKAGSFEKLGDMQVIMKKLGQLGRQLEEAGVVPDFSEPVSTSYDKHPVLGDVAHEIYDVVVDGRPVEWHMAYDQEGRVWIDRIRYGDTLPTPYGTDKDVIYSGLLTSKPIDYDEQVAGLPEPVKIKNVNGSKYTDISRFLNTFEPIAKFRAQRFSAPANS
jgi:hypothetical protein